MAYAFLGKDDLWAEPHPSDPGSPADLEGPQRNGSGGTAGSVAATGNKSIDGILSGVKWNGSITYSAPDAVTDYQGGYWVNHTEFDGVGHNGFSAFTAQQLTAFHFALNTAGASAGFSVAGFTGLNIKFIGGGSGAGTIRGANADAANPTAFAFYPHGSWYGGDAFFGNTQNGTSSSLKTPAAGNWAWHTMLHEMGHSLGLKHGHETQGGVGGALPTAFDSIEFSIMTYRGYIGAPGNGYSYEQWGAPQTFMMLDIAALQHMYGADFTTNKGNTVYTWTPSSGDTKVNGKVAIDAGGNRIFATIWDGGGVDTYNLSAYNTAVTIDLRPGKHSVFSEVQLAHLGGGPNDGFARGNIFNALQYRGDPRSLIENAIGGSGDDLINGNNANNVLRGGDGNDRLYGHSGNDTLLGGAGNDAAYGGLGNDRINGDAGNDLLRGGAGIDKLYGGDGNDRLYGDAGNDLLFGGAGNDRLEGGVGNDRLYGGDGLDVIYGRAGADIAYGGAHNDRIYGGEGKDRLYGDAGDDLIKGGLDNDRIYGGSGNDRLYGEAGDDFLYGDAGNDYLKGWLGNDRLYGGAGDDRLYGEAGSDFLYGGAGVDRLYGGAGTDRFYGGEGNDLIYGGEGKDFAYFTGPMDDYVITESSGTTIVRHVGGTAADGIDRLVDVEYLIFSDQVLVL